MAKQVAETAIQAEEAHFVFSTGMAAGVKPWLNDSAILLLGDKDAGQLLLAPRIKLPIGKWQGKLVVTPTDLTTAIQNDPTTAVGILPTTIADLRRPELRTLAFQSIGQHGAFYPDRKATTFDKQNVRDGHYSLWGYLHMILRVDPAQKPTSATGARLADILLGRSQVAGKDVLPMQIGSGLVPQCAMRVARTSDSGPLTPTTVANGCGCWFEKSVTGGQLNCQECSGGTACASGQCRRNLCEVQ
jgi:hypothetical protein